METLSSLVLLVGMCFVLVASLGLVKMPDVFSRMQTSTKATTLGVLCVFLVLVLQSPALGTKVQALLVMVFVMLTAPISAHMLGRGAYIRGNKMWPENRTDELAEQKQKMYFQQDEPPAGD